MKQNQKEFMIDLANIAVFDNVLEDIFIVKKGSHNRYAGWVTLLQEDDPDKTLYKITPQNLWASIRKVCDENVDGLEDETEKNILLADKRLDTSVLEPDDILVLFHLACFGELQ